MAILTPEMRCYECGNMMNGQKGAYKYTECGLNSVILKDVLVYRCDSCGSVVPEIQAAGLLHRIIALRLVRKQNSLTGGEVRFLRKFCGYSVNDFADITGSSKSVISRWEKNGCGKGTDRIIRLLVITKLMREIAGAPAPVLRNVSVERLMDDLENALKMMGENKNESPESYEISPEEIANFSGGVEASTEIEAVIQ